MNRTILAALRRQSRTGTLVASLMLAAVAAPPAMALTYQAEVVASGLNHVRSLAFAPDGALWIGEAGVPGGTGPSTILRGQTLTYNETGALARLQGAVLSRPVTGLPALFETPSGLMAAGTNGMAFDATGGLVRLHGLGMNPNVRFGDLAPVGYQFGRLVRADGSTVDVAAHEAANNPDSGPVDSNPFRIARSGDSWLVTDAGANALLRVGDDGTVSTVATFAARSIGGPFPTESVPTGLAVGGDGAAYVGELTGFPFIPGAARVLRVAADGSQSVWASGFTNIIDIEFDTQGRLMVLELDSNGLIAPGGTGRLWQVAADGASRSLIWSDGLIQPIDMAIAADGSFYIANFANATGLGEVLRVSAVPEPGAYALMALGLVAIACRARRRS